MIGVTLGKEIAVSTAENCLVNYISYVASEVGVPLKSSQGVYSSDSTPLKEFQQHHLLESHQWVVLKSIQEKTLFLH